jgi:signal transduction histidine kinase
MPIMFVLGLARLRARRARVGELVMELGDLPTPEQLQVLLRRTLGDPSLEVGLWVPDAKRFLTAEGATLHAPDAPDLTSTVLERHGEPLALIVHDAALLDDPSLIDSVTAATRLAVENDRLQQEVLEKLVEVHDSRARLLQAADSERKRIERNLHDGAQQRLVSATLGLRMLGAKVGEESQVHDSIKKVEDELKGALEELRELARGTYPALLTERGIAAALETLADRSEIPVRKDLDSLRDRRFPENVEATAYFAGSEALANASKHSQASLIKLSARADDRDLIITVADDGRGGASIKKGSGLRGLLDRIHAADGDMDVESSSEAGTTITIRLPCE